MADKTREPSVGQMWWDGGDKASVVRIVKVNPKSYRVRDRDGKVTTRTVANLGVYLKG